MKMKNRNKKYKIQIKMNIKYLWLIVWGVIVNQVLYAHPLQSNDSSLQQCKAKIDKINNLDLYKGCVMYNTSDNSHFVVTPSNKDIEYEENVYSSDICVYYDSAGRIRKYESIHKSMYIDATVVDVMYFDANESLCYRLFYNEGEGDGLKGKMYANGSSILLFEGSVYSSNHGIDKWIDFSYTTTLLPSYFYIYNFKIGNINDLKSHLNSDLSMPQNCPKVRFCIPHIGDTTIISGNDVYIRYEPTINGSVMGKSNVGDLAQILVVGSKETIEGLGCHHWFKIRWEFENQECENVKVEGYIFGAFLEPVEKVITE